VGNLHTNLTEDDLKAVFEPFGEIQSINLHIDPETGRSKGFAFVQYKSAEDAKKALQHCNGMELAGRQLKVGIVSDPGTLTAGGPGAGLGGLPAFGGAPGFGGGFGGQFGGGGGGHFGGGGGGGGFGGGGLNELDDEGGGLGLNAQSRAMLMARLAGQTGGVGFPTLPGAPMSFPMTSGFPGGLLPGVVPGMGLPGMPVLPGLPALGGLGAPSPLLPTAGAMPIVSPTVAPRPVASAFMLLKNMFDPAKETEPNFHLDIQEDVTEECAKYGKVLQCHVVRDSPSGLVYLKFESTDGATKAIQALNGRWFAGKVISAEFIDENTFLAGCKL
jgi:RNA-binding protein 39